MSEYRSLGERLSWYTFCAVPTLFVLAVIAFAIWMIFADHPQRDTYDCTDHGGYSVCVKR